MESKSERNSLLAGRVCEQQFDLLLEGTSIRGEGVLAALKEHLVHGVAAKSVCEKYGVNKSQFSRRLKVLQIESERVAKLSIFYQKG